MRRSSSSSLSITFIGFFLTVCSSSDCRWGFQKQCASILVELVMGSSEGGAQQCCVLCSYFCLCSIFVKEFAPKSSSSFSLSLCRSNYYCKAASFASSSSTCDPALRLVSSISLSLAYNSQLASYKLSISSYNCCLSLKFSSSYTFNYFMRFSLRRMISSNCQIMSSVPSESLQF